MDRPNGGAGPSPRPGRSGRLPSFKGQRDLSLGAPKDAAAKAAKGPQDAKRKFVPNLNVQRAVKKEKDETKKPGDGKPNKERRQRGKGGGGDGGKGKGPHAHGKGRPELIQTMGSVFSEGAVGLEGIRRRGGASYRSSDPSSSEGSAPRGAIGADIKVDKEEEERRLRALMKDDFIEDLGADGLFVPVQLPMVDTGKVFKEEEKTGPEKSLTRKKKLNVIDSDDDDDVEAASMDVGEQTKPVIDKRSSDAEAVEVTFPELVRNQKGDLLFIQVPDHLPGAPPPKKEGQDEPPKFCTLPDLPEGYLGKIQIHKSGKTQLKIGEDLFDLELGTQVGFLQDLVSVDAGSNPREVGDMTVMGRVRHRLVLTPDWEHLFDTKSGAGGEHEEAKS